MKNEIGKKAISVISRLQKSLAASGGYEVAACWQQAEEKGVFLRFEDDGAAMKANLHLAIAIGRKIRHGSGDSSSTIEHEFAIDCSRIKVAKRFV